MALRRVLVANRGEIAVRVVRTCHDMGIEAVLAVSEADRDSLAARLADRVVCIGPAQTSQSYLNATAVVAAALGTGCDSVHPGYGFLAENSNFAGQCEANGLIFIGPPAAVIRNVGDKVRAKEEARNAGLATVPSSDRLTSLGEAEKAAGTIGFPIALKAVGGGGGRGIRVLTGPQQLAENFEACAAEAQATFGNSELYVERYIRQARHLEVQILSDANGRAVHLWDRDCSVQRRFQKVVEEAPASMVPEDVRKDVVAGAIRLAERLGYRGAGTVESIVDAVTREAFFIEMNARVQVEHPVSEVVTGVDVIREQLRIAAGEPVSVNQADIEVRGHAIECRITAESPEDLSPRPGRIVCWSPPTFLGVRVDTHCYSGYLASPYYDSMLAKLITFGHDRAEAVRRMSQALSEFEVTGIQTNMPFLRRIVHDVDFMRGDVHTRWLEERLMPVTGEPEGGESLA